MKSCVFIGGGNMASCIVSGLSKIHTDEYRITVCDPNQTKLDILKEKYNGVYELGYNDLVDVLLKY